MDLNLMHFKYSALNANLDTYVKVPYDGSLEELAYMLLLNNHLPRHLHKDLVQELNIFVEQHTKNKQDVESTALLQAAKDSQFNLDDATREWEKRMKEEMAEYGEQRCASNEELFATAYHKMVHSPASETMLQVEHMYAKIVSKRSYEKLKQVDDLADKQTDEMNKAVERLEDDMTEVKINELATQHYENFSFLRTQLNSELDTIKEAQRREYREWLMQMLEENQTNSSLPTPSSPLSPNVMMLPPNRPFAENTVSDPVLEESFTIHLGSQLKQMHNIRILSADILDLCTIKVDELSEPTPQTLQTALNLYSNDLYGLVLMSDGTSSLRSSKAFKNICRSTTELHFGHIDDQMEKIGNVYKEFKEGCKSKQKATSSLRTGDFYITKHSNLAQVHVIFHIATDDSVKGNDINSRHPVVLGLRNILKTACSNDVTSLTIPLLLASEMSEDMTISWCEKRSELVFKCIKGFMIEMASWGGSDLKNLQFMLPQGISAEVFQSLTEMLPRIFKVSNPLILN